MTNWRPITLLHSSDTLGLYWLTIKMVTECWQWFNIVTPVRTQLRTVHGQGTQEMLNFYKAKKDPWKGSFRLKVNLRSISATSHCRTTTSLSPIFFFLVCAGTHLNHSLKKTNEKQNAWFCSSTTVGKLEITTPTKYTLPVFCFYLNLDKSDWTHRMVSFLTGTYRSNWDLKGEFCIEIVGLLVLIRV